jgi:hypothetical protein
MVPVKIEGAGWLEDCSEDISRGAVIASQAQQGTAALPPSRPFAVGRAGFDYFADQQHYSFLAARVVAGLRQGGRIALVTGDSPISPLSLATALTEATAGKHSVVAICCGDDFNEDQLRRAAGPSPLLLFCQADRLSDGQLSRLCSYLIFSESGPPGVLLGQAGFVARLEKLLRPFEDGRVICFNFYELGRDEIDVFIRRQLCPGETADAFSVDAVNWIADLSTGDPAQVNRLSRLILEFVSRTSGTGPAGDCMSPQVPPTITPRWRKAMSRPAQIGILLCLGISVLLAVTGGPEFGRIGAPRESSSDGPLASEQTAAPRESSSDGPLASEQTAASPPAGVAAANSTEITPPPSEPATAPASSATAPPPTKPATASAFTEPAPPPTEPATASAFTEPAPPPTEPATASAFTEPAPPPTEPVAAPASTATAPPPTEPVAAPASTATAPPPTESAAAPASTKTTPPSTAPTTASAFTETAPPPTEPAAAPASTATAPPPAEPAAAPASAETAPPSTEPVTAPASAATAPPPAEPVAAPASTEIAPLPAEPIDAANSTETTPTEAATARGSTPPTEAATARDSTETAPPAGTPAFTETVPLSLSTGPIAKRAETARPLPAEQIAMLLARGDAFMQTRDIVSARLLYERAADAGNGRAALRMGESFDPAFLDRIGIYRSIGDRELALSWYRRARELGDTEAAQLLEKLDAP